MTLYKRAWKCAMCDRDVFVDSETKTLYCERPTGCPEVKLPAEFFHSKEFRENFVRVLC